jgi:hypothetical protein
MTVNTAYFSHFHEVMVQTCYKYYVLQVSLQLLFEKFFFPIRLIFSILQASYAQVGRRNACYAYVSIIVVQFQPTLEWVNKFEYIPQ